MIPFVSDYTSISFEIFLNAFKVLQQPCMVQDPGLDRDGPRTVLIRSKNALTWYGTVSVELTI
jgi:hypothetical protein